MAVIGGGYSVSKVCLSAQSVPSVLESQVVYSFISCLLQALFILYMLFCFDVVGLIYDSLLRRSPTVPLKSSVLINLFPIPHQVRKSSLVLSCPMMVQVY